MLRHITIGTPGGEKTYLVRGDYTEKQLKDLYEKFKSKFKSDIPFERWLREYGRVYVRTKDSSDRRARLHRALDAMMDRVRIGDGSGSPAFKAGRGWYLSKLNSMKGGGAIMLDQGADLYLKKMGYEGTLSLPPSSLYTPSVRARYNLAKQMKEDFIDGGAAAHEERLAKQRNSE